MSQYKRNVALLSLEKNNVENAMRGYHIQIGSCCQFVVVANRFFPTRHQILPSPLRVSGKDTVSSWEMKWCFRPLLCTLFRLNWAGELVGENSISPGKPCEINKYIYIYIIYIYIMLLILWHEYNNVCFCVFSVSGAGCAASEFECCAGTPACININYLMDKRIDCADGSDER